VVGPFFGKKVAIVRFHFMRLLALLSLVAVGRVAFADDTSAAREHYHRGTKLYDVRKYKEAAKEYEEAYEAKDDPALLFNIGQAHRLAGDYDEAIAAYLAFLRRVPKSPQRIEVQKRVREMRELVDQQRKTQAGPPEGTIGPTAPPHVEPSRVEPPPVAVVEPPPPVTLSPPPPPADRPDGRKKTIAGAVVGAAGLALAAVGAGFAVMAHNESNRLTNARSGTVFDPAADQRGRTDQGVAIGLLAGGGAALVAGVVVLALGRVEARHARRFAVAPTVGRDRAGLSMAVGF
jgi:hypothetical protein